MAGHTPESDTPDTPDANFAFPWVSDHRGMMCTGMTLRDWFAGQALAGQTSSFEGEQASRNAARQRGMATTAFIASCCYEYADAMLAARKVQP